VRSREPRPFSRLTRMPTRASMLPAVFTFFAAQPGGEPSDLPLPVDPRASRCSQKTLTDKLKDYNSSHSIMDLVLSSRQWSTLCAFAASSRHRRGNAMLIGVGGSGKQSLSNSRPPSAAMTSRQLSVTSKFTVMDLKENVKDYYRAGKGCYSVSARSLLRHWSSHLASRSQRNGPRLPPH